MLRFFTGEENRRAGRKNVESMKVPSKAMKISTYA
jgi:hypothetical protein